MGKWETYSKVVSFASIIPIVLLIVACVLAFIASNNYNSSPENIDDKGCKKEDYMIIPIIGTIFLLIGVVGSILFFILTVIQSKSTSPQNYKTAINVNLLYFVGVCTLSLIFFFISLIRKAPLQA
jgi:hypothetical protein